LYGHNWRVAFNECEEWVEELVTSVGNKRTFYQGRLKAITLIPQAL
jgi:bifunctional pyridoxal-dependent enzyme with beta-cystathionase and maltose regulon repressor activities